jgi:probable HAF family extracellular repeat protein
MSSCRWFSPLIPALLLLSGAGAIAQTYRVVDLATLAQGNAAVVRGPNVMGVGVGSGTLTGTPNAGGRRRGLLFGAGPARQIAGPADSDDTTVYELNDTGGLVGSSNTATGLRAFAGTQAGAARELPPLGGDNSSAAYGTNNQGQAVGFSSGAGGQRAVIWDANGTPSALPARPNTGGTRAVDINERGDVAGVASTAAGQRPILWPRGQPAVELMLLAGHATGEANAINARGDVVGYSANASGVRRAAFWPANGGGVVDLGTLPGGNFSQAFGSNGAGDTVGTSNSRAVLWARGGGIQDLNRLIAPSTFVLTKAVGINDSGNIIATGYDVPAGHSAEPHTHEDEHDLPVRVFLLVRSGGGQ